jgi:hypothetical protein
MGTLALEWADPATYGVYLNIVPQPIDPQVVSDPPPAVVP